MHNYYIINDAVEFHPAKRTLRDLKNPGVVTELTSPSGRCLLLLLSRIGMIVSQNEFRDIVWNQSGMSVSSNTYYQNISVLRKGLKRIGLGDDIIVTIPRLGLTLAAGTRVRVLKAESYLERNTQDLCHTETVTTAPPGVPSAEAKNTPAEQVEYHGKKSLAAKRELIAPLFGFGFAFALALVAALLLMLPFILNTKGNHFSDYVPVASTKGCEFFLSRYFSKDSHEKYLKNYANRFNGDCQKHPWVYVSKVPDLSRTSVIRCSRPFDEAGLCISEGFIE
jgi:DNA-binding winged helix-turn-helix (wHTH) protein